MSIIPGSIMNTKRALIVFLLVFVLGNTSLGLAEVIKFHYPSGKLMAELNFKNGKRDGISKAYYESGKLKGELNYKNGEQEGISREYYENGKIRYIDTFKDGQKIERKACDLRGKLKQDHSQVD
jgi:antitoxin component YwqK of YwqJK toxin-antitoxin module